MNKSLTIVLGAIATVVIVLNVTSPFIIGMTTGLTTIGGYYLGRGDKQ